MRPGAVVAVCLGVAGAALSIGVAVHEWSYHQDHPGRTGVSGVLTVLGSGAALGCLAVVVLAWVIGRGRRH